MKIQEAIEMLNSGMSTTVSENEYLAIETLIEAVENVIEVLKEAEKLPNVIIGAEAIERYNNLIYILKEKLEVEDE